MLVFSSNQTKRVEEEEDFFRDVKLGICDIAFFLFSPLPS
jgi:hypothetical protein